jgi:hypothetical protein
MMTILATLVQFTSAADRNAKRGDGYGTVLGDSCLVKLAEPVKFGGSYRHGKKTKERTTRYIWVSTSCVGGEWETYAFPAYSNGKVHCWREMYGSQRHDADMSDPHAVVLGEMNIAVA